MKRSNGSLANVLPIAAIALTLAVASGCGSSSSSTSASTTTAPIDKAPAPVLPVAADPISNTSTAAGLTITSALVENNVSPETGKAVDDHLEVALENTSTRPLDHLELYYVVIDKARGVTEGYYSRLDGITIQPGATRVVHFDNTGAMDHYPVNKYGLYYTDKNALVVDVVASAPGVKVATFSVRKDAGGAEAGVE